VDGSAAGRATSNSGVWEGDDVSVQRSRIKSSTREREAGAIELCVYECVRAYGSIDGSVNVEGVQYCMIVRLCGISVFVCA